MLKIGTLSLPSRCLLAPMAGVSDLPFRLVHRSFGCEFAFTEMISARSLVYQSRNTMKMLSTVPADSPLGVQLLGDEPDVIRKAVEILREYKISLIDFNAACPVNKVTSRGEGASLMKDPRKLGMLLRVIVDNADVPVTVKIRAGWDDSSLNARDVALCAQDAGIQGLFIHGRTRGQGYSGGVDYRIISEVKSSLAIPVIGSGDAFSPQLIKKMFDATGCDGVAIARGALGNPWIFRETEHFLAGSGIIDRPAIDEIVNTMIMHLDLCTDFHGEKTGTVLFRKFIGWYTKGIPGTKFMRETAFQAETKSEMIGIIKGLHMEGNSYRESFSLPLC